MSEGRAGGSDGGGPGGGDEAGGDPGRGRLFVVATPIGNLGDVTLRALEILRAVPLIAAEDTRLTRRLLDRHEVEARTISYHARSGPVREAELLAHLAGGQDLALVTDAGTPGVSDPGEGLVSAWAAAGGTVVPIPGASAVLAAVAVDAHDAAGHGHSRRHAGVVEAADDRATIVYEAPGRVAATLRDLADACGPQRPAAICRELTKLHEEFVRAPLGQLARQARDGELTLRGEFAIVVGERRGQLTPTAASEAAAADALVAALADVERLVAAGTPRGEAARRVAVASGLQRRQLYAAPRDS